MKYGRCGNKQRPKEEEKAQTHESGKNSENKMDRKARKSK
jgi:hypothetical protein